MSIHKETPGSSKRENNKVAKAERTPVTKRGGNINKVARVKKTATFIVKTKTNNSLFQDKVNKANSLLNKASLLNKRAAAG